MPAKYATLEVRKTLEGELDGIHQLKGDSYAWSGIAGKDKIVDKEKKLKDGLAAITPPDVKGAEKDNIKKRLGMLSEAMRNGNSVVPAMASHEEAWKVPAGAVGRQMAWDQYWKTHTLDLQGNPVKVDPKKGGRGAQSEYQDLCRVYFGRDGEENDPEVASLEMIRPENRSIPLEDVRLPKSYGFSSLAKERYEETFPDHEPTPVEKKLDGRRTRELPEEVRCKMLKNNGEPCNTPRMAGKDYCGFHKPKEEPLDVGPQV